MTRFLFFWMALASSAQEPPWQDLSLTIVADSATSGDNVTLCRVRVVNHGDRTWPGHRIRFEADALEGETVMDRARGRFGLSLGPRETLETLIGFSGRYGRFAVRLLPTDSEGSRSRPRGARSSGKRRGRPRR
jgi:hypothetical protein